MSFCRVGVRSTATLPLAGEGTWDEDQLSQSGGTP